MKLREIHSLHFLSISSHPFPISKSVSFCCKMLKIQHFCCKFHKKNLTYTCYEKIILGCEKALQVVRAWHKPSNIDSTLNVYLTFDQNKMYVSPTYQMADQLVFLKEKVFCKRNPIIDLYFDCCNLLNYCMKPALFENPIVSLCKLHKVFRGWETCFPSHTPRP